MSRDLSALGIAHAFLTTQIPMGGTCVDATVGRGKDTAFLCSLVGAAGTVIGFDIQQEALDSAFELLESQDKKAKLILDSHSKMADYLEPGSVDGITFNFGWLPGGDHTISTQPDTSIKAIEAGLALLKPGGVMSLCIYYGKDTGYTERDALLEYVATIDNYQYTVLVTKFTNRPNDPPIPVQIYKNS